MKKKLDGMNDIWKFDLLSLNWSLVFDGDIEGVYGTKDFFDPTYIPKGRSQSASCASSMNGNLFVFGGLSCKIYIF